MNRSLVGVLTKSCERNVNAYQLNTQFLKFLGRNGFSSCSGKGFLSKTGCQNNHIFISKGEKSLLNDLIAALRGSRKLHSPIRPVKVYNKEFIPSQCPLWTKLRGFHTTDPKKAVPPVLLLVLRPILKLFAMLFGRFLKKWWSKLTPEEKKVVLVNFSRKWAKYTGFSSVIGFGAGSVFYGTHLEIDPLTNRKRFIMFSESQIEQLAEMEMNQLVEVYKTEILPAIHPSYQRVTRVAHRLLLANMDIKEIKKHDWKVTVIKSEQVNAFVLPNGSIFIFSGILDVCLNDDQLGIVLGHEMSHCLLKHVSELLSQSHILDLLLLIPIVFIWALLPSSLAALAHGFAEYWQSFRYQLPYNRKLELEADHVGLMLAAKACFDVREASAFWAQMELNDFAELPGKPKIEEWMSTHPSHENRRAILDGIMDQAVQIRNSQRCPALPRIDPRVRLNAAKPVLR